MKQSSKRLVSVGIGLLLVVAALVVFFDLVQPEYGNIVQLKGELAGESGLLQTEKQVVASTTQMIAEYQQQGEQEQGTVDLAMPTTQDVAGALAQIYGLAENNGISISTISVSAPVLQAQTSLLGEASTTSIVKPIGAFSFQISGAGSYESLKSFLSGLETNIRVFDVKAISVSPPQGSSSAKPGAAPQDFFTYTITVATYYQTQ